MKRILSVLLAAILLLSVPACVTAEEEREILQSGDFSYAVLDDGTVEITKWAGSETSLEIPSTLDGKKVTRIGDEAFSYCGSLTAVTIPDSVTSIGDYAFYSCNRLAVVTIPDSVTSIGDSAFSYCGSLTAVTIPDSVSQMGANPFRHCNKLTSINVSLTHPYIATIDGVLYEKATKKLVCYPYAFTATEFAIPQGIAAIGDSAFDFCKSLTSVTIPDSVTSIGDYAFDCCSSLTSVTIPDSVTSIGDRAFSYCFSLTAVTIPDSVTTIGNSAFYDCSRLTSVTIPKSVTFIGNDAFSVFDDENRNDIPNPKLTLTVPHDSYAEAYCKGKGLRYIYPDTNDWLYN